MERSSLLRPEARPWEMDAFHFRILPTSWEHPRRLPLHFVPNTQLDV